MTAIFLFIDGVGLGARADENPLWNDRWKGFSFISGGRPLTRNVAPLKEKRHFFAGVDATLGVEGLPQSGTGQAALFTGANTAQKIGKHFGPFPHSGVKPLLKNHSLFNKAQAAGKSCAFINAYPDVFFEKARSRNRWTCTTLMTKSAGIRLNTVEDVKNKRALTAGLTQQAWRSTLHIDIPQITPEEAARRLISQARNYDLLLHEYYLTDKAGHSRDKQKADKYINRYDRFLGELIQSKLPEMTLVLCSDHGNIEDLSTKTHTLNRAPLFAYGPGSEAFHQANSIMDVTPGILHILEN